MKFSLFRKPKQQAEPENSTVPPEQPNPETALPQTTENPEASQSKSPAEVKENIENTNSETSASQPEQTMPQESTVLPQELKKEAAQAQGKTYLKAMPLKELSDIENVKNEVKNGNIIILRVTPLANKSVEEVKTAVNQLYEFTESVGGDIARLGEERVVICPKNIRIWREKTPASSGHVPGEALPTAA